MACRTCDMIRGLLLSQGVPSAVADKSVPLVAAAEEIIKPAVKRKASAYAKRYGRAFKKVAKKYKKKSGGWMKDGFRRAQREAHKIARRGK